jgi:hypothetical protein
MKTRLVMPLLVMLLLAPCLVVWGQGQDVLAPPPPPPPPDGMGVDLGPIMGMLGMMPPPMMGGGGVAIAAAGDYVFVVIHGQLHQYHAATLTLIKSVQLPRPPPPAPPPPGGMVGPPPPPAQ